MKINEIRNVIWQIAKFAMFCAFMCMDLTRSFPTDSWAKFFDTIFIIAITIWFVIGFFDVKITKQ